MDTATEEDQLALFQLPSKTVFLRLYLKGFGMGVITEYMQLQLNVGLGSQQN
jgi:hypothetical protein